MATTAEAITPRIEEPTVRQAGLELVRDGLRKMADGVHLLLLGEPGEQQAGPKLVRPQEELLTIKQAAALLGVHRNQIYRMTLGKACRRRVGQRGVRIEKAGLLALTRRA